MSHAEEDHLPAELEGVANRLRAARVQPTALELDRLKLRARSQASSSQRKQGSARSGVLAVLLTGGLLIGGTAGVLGASGGGTVGSAATSQYGHGKRHHHGKPHSHHHHGKRHHDHKHHKHHH